MRNGFRDSKPTVEDSLAIGLRMSVSPRTAVPAWTKTARSRPVPAGQPETDGYEEYTADQAVRWWSRANWWPKRELWLGRQRFIAAESQYWT
jgi:hypothetical protein